MRIEPSALERFQSARDDRAATNVAARGVQPLTVAELGRPRAVVIGERHDGARPHAR